VDEYGELIDVSENSPETTGYLDYDSHVGTCDYVCERSFQCSQYFQNSVHVQCKNGLCSCTEGFTGDDCSCSYPGVIADKRGPICKHNGQCLHSHECYPEICIFENDARAGTCGKAETCQTRSDCIGYDWSTIDCINGYCDCIEGAFYNADSGDCVCWGGFISYNRGVRVCLPYNKCNWSYDCDGNTCIPDQIQEYLTHGKRKSKGTCSYFEGYLTLE
jgi:hypothetical protein